ncbi:hypothetical protein ACN20G_28065 (plasmid) [Streptomyces sp. BI20]|uniref:hypothetical protein n=1 Tax=Streptomyces sp. BI20 TaxID=3403460 RepID=UPI003C776EDD
MTSEDRLMNLDEIADMFGVARQTAQRWHRNRPGVTHKRPPALRAVAHALGRDIPEADEDRPLYPRSILTAFGKGVGYLDGRGRRIELQSAGQKWLPVEPTYEPGGRRRRWYLNHVADHTGIAKGTLEVRRSRGAMPKSDGPEELDGLDELGRPFWYPATLNKWARDKNLNVTF